MHKTKPVPTIEKYMSTTPIVVEAKVALSDAEKIMKENDIRHLPVVHGNKVVGILSDRDIKFAKGLVNFDPSQAQVGDIASGEVYTVTPKASITEVVSKMAGRKLGSTVVVDNEKLVGIFTDIDALRALDTLLKTRLA